MLIASWPVSSHEAVEYFTPIANTCPRGESPHQLEGMFKKVRPARPQPFDARSEHGIREHGKMARRRWRPFSTFPTCIQTRTSLPNRSLLPSGWGLNKPRPGLGFLSTVTIPLSQETHRAPPHPASPHRTASAQSTLFRDPPVRHRESGHSPLEFSQAVQETGQE